jgi:hypothetical protein
MSRVNFTRAGTWARLLPQALRLMADVESHIPGAVWTLGGGTVLMLRFDHRQSRDIDLFVPDPQYLGYVTPRLSTVAETISISYEESADAVKLFCDDGEIDVIVAPLQTTPAFEVCRFGRRMINVETTAEILAKKMWHRGNRATARDLFDLCAIADLEPAAISVAAPFMTRHGAEFLRQLSARREYLSVQFAQIDSRGYGKSYDDCVGQAQALIRPLLPGSGSAVSGPGRN